MSRMTLMIVLTASLAGCSLLTSLDGLGGGDAAGGDASSPVDGGSDGSGGGNLLSNPGFEQGQGGCGSNWGNGYGMTFTRVSPGRTGQYACEVCISTGSTSYAFDSLVPIPVNAGSYYSEAWIMTPDGGVAEQGGIGVLIAYDIDAGITGCSGVGAYCQGSFSTPPEGTWTKSTASFVASGSGTATVGLHSYGATAGSCFVVDDVAFYAQ